MPMTMPYSLTTPSLPTTIPLSPLVASLRVSTARTSLAAFIKLTWHLVEPSQSLVWNWHLDVVCKELERITHEGCNNQVLVINIPPGTGKSLIVGVFWPAWEWTQRADYRYLTASYSEPNTLRDNRRLRNIVTSDLYQSLFWNNYKSSLNEDNDNIPYRQVSLSGEQAAKVRFDTTEMGWRIASSVEGLGTGEHPHRIIVDDPVKAKKALSLDAHMNVVTWLRGTISTRNSLDPATVLIMQRLHEADPSNYLTSDNKARHIVLPMRYSKDGYKCPCHKDGPDHRDIRTVEGELLFPQRYPEEKVVVLETKLGPTDASGQLGQRPIPLGGGHVKEAWLPIRDTIPVGSSYRDIRGWDLAATQDAGDWTAGSKVRIIYDYPIKGQFMLGILHVKRARVEDADPVILAVAEADGKSVGIREEQEGGSSGKKVIKYHGNMLAGYDFAGVPVSGKSKPMRFRPFRAQAELGNVFLLRGEWNQPYIDELCALWLGRHDDQADATSCAANELLLTAAKPSALVGKHSHGVKRDRMGKIERESRRKGHVIRLRTFGRR